MKCWPQPAIRVAGHRRSGLPRPFLLIPRVMQTDEVYTGGGSETALVRVSTQALLRANWRHESPESENKQEIRTAAGKDR